jgi:hypothetical protein
MLMRQITRPRLDPTPVLRRLCHPRGKGPFTFVTAPRTDLDLHPVRRYLNPDSGNVKRLTLLIAYRFYLRQRVLAMRAAVHRRGLAMVHLIRKIHRWPSWPGWPPLGFSPFGRKLSVRGFRFPFLYPSVEGGLLLVRLSLERRPCKALIASPCCCRTAASASTCCPNSTKRETTASSP